MYVCLYICVYVYVYVCIYVYVYICICVYVYIYICVYVCIDINTQKKLFIKFAVQYLLTFHSSLPYFNSIC